MIEYLGVWCPTCQQDCIPMRDGTCGFCGNPVDATQTTTRPAKARELVDVARTWPDPLPYTLDELAAALARLDGGPE